MTLSVSHENNKSKKIIKQKFQPAPNFSPQAFIFGLYQGRGGIPVIGTPPLLRLRSFLLLDGKFA
jgi:hypothetical protein